MKLEEVKGVDLTKVKIKLTAELKSAYENYSSKGEDEVYLVGSMMGDWFISPLPPNTKGKRTVYPMPLEVEPHMFTECEVIEILEDE